MSFCPHTQRAFFEEYTFTQKMDQDVARVKNATGLTLLCVDLPEKINRAMIEFGINLFAHRVCDGGRWKGAKMLPRRRLHFAFVGTTEGGGGTGSRVGEFLYAEEEGEVEIRTWDARNERFYSSSSERRNGDQHLTAKEEEEEKEKEKEQKERLILGVKRGDFDAELGAYEEDSREDLRWRSLVSLIDLECLKRCEVEPGVMFVPGGVGRCLDAYGRKKRLARDVVEEEGAKEEEEEDRRTAKFTFKATTRVPEDASAEMLTKIHVDCRFRFERALNMFGGNREAMLAEQQLAYVLFFTFGCGKGLEQWKELTVIIANVMVEYMKEEVERKTGSEQSAMKDARIDQKGEEKEFSSFFVGFLDSLEAQFNDDATNEGTLDEVVSELAPSNSRDEKQLSDILRDAISKSYRVVASSPSFPRDVDDATFGWLARFETTAKRVLHLKIFKKRTPRELHNAHPTLIVDHDAETEDEQPLIVELPEGEYARMDKDEDEIEVVVVAEAEAEDKNNIAKNENSGNAHQNRMSWMVQ